VTLLERESQLGSLLRTPTRLARVPDASCWSPERPGSASRPWSRSTSAASPTATWRGAPATACSSHGRSRPCTTSPVRSAGAVLDAVADGAPREQSSTRSALGSRVRAAWWFRDRGRPVGRTRRPSTCCDSSAWVRDLPVLLVVTFRDDAMAPSDPLRVTLGSSRPALHAPHRPAAADRRRKCAVSPRDVVTPRSSCTSSPANPFFVVEVLSEHGTQVPVSARDAVLSRAAGSATRAEPRRPVLAGRVAGGPAAGRRRGRVTLETFESCSQRACSERRATPAVPARARPPRDRVRGATAPPTGRTPGHALRR
jgi:hypothetical protein